MARLTRFALFAAEEACRNAGAAHRGDCGLVVGLTHGTTSFLQEFHDYLFDYGPQMASPSAFSNGVTNAPLGAVSKLCGLTAGGATLVGCESCGMQVLHHAACAIADGDFGWCCAGAAEEYSQLVADVYARLGWFGGELPGCLPCSRPGTAFPQSEGSVFLVLSRAQEAPARGCYFSPIGSIEELEGDVDVIISGAGGGPQDSFERQALAAALSRQDKAPLVLFPKCFFGETFAVGALLSGAMAWDILVNGTAYPAFPLENALAPQAGSRTDFSAVRSVLVISAGRTGDVLAGVFNRPGPFRRSGNLTRERVLLDRKAVLS